jgi:hypothetical protein
VQERRSAMLVDTWRTDGGLAYRTWNLQCIKALLLPYPTSVKPKICVQCHGKDDERGATGKNQFKIVFHGNSVRNSQCDIINKLLKQELTSTTLDHPFVSIFASHEFLRKSGLECSPQEVWDGAIISTGMEHTIRIYPNEFTVFIAKIEQ